MVRIAKIVYDLLRSKLERELGSQLRDRRAHYRFLPGKGLWFLASEASLALCLARCALLNKQRADIGETKRLPAGRFLRHDHCFPRTNLARPAEHNLGQSSSSTVSVHLEASIRKAFSLPSSQGSSVTTALAVQGMHVSVPASHPTNVSWINVVYKGEMLY